MLWTGEYTSPALNMATEPVHQLLGHSLMQQIQLHDGWSLQELPWIAFTLWAPLDPQLLANNDSLLQPLFFAVSQNLWNACGIHL